MKIKIKNKNAYDECQIQSELRLIALIFIKDTHFHTLTAN